MKILQIENLIDKNVQIALTKGMIIINGSWGIRNIEGALDTQSNWISINNMCCPLGSIILNKDYELKSYGSSIKYSAYPYIADILGVSYEWIHSFMMGFEAKIIGNWEDQEAYNLGFKTRAKYIGIKI